MPRSAEEMVAYALEIEPRLLPHAPELLADLEELGSDADVIVEALRRSELPPEARIADLGSGKGAVALEIADRLSLPVLGIDLFAPFVESSRVLAEEEGLSELCEFRHGDVAALAGTLPPFDAVVFAALGDVLGSLDVTIGIIRRYVAPGGAMVIGDGFLAEGGLPTFSGFEGMVPREETRQRLEQHGDRIEHELISPPEPSRGENTEDAMISARAEALAERHPELRESLLDFVRGQRAENEYLATNVVDAVWVVRRT